MNLDIRNDIIERLLTIYHELKDSIITNTMISELLNIGHNYADTCIKVLLSYNLIKPIKGLGKGKYKFINNNLK